MGQSGHPSAASVGLPGAWNLCAGNTGYDPLLDNEPQLARSMATSVRQRIAYGERSGEKVQHIGHSFGYEGERPELKGMHLASVNGFSLHANTDAAAHRGDQLDSFHCPLLLLAFAKRYWRSMKPPQASAYRGSARCGSVCQRFSIALLPHAWLSPAVVVS